MPNTNFTFRTDTIHSRAPTTHFTIFKKVTLGICAIGLVIFSATAATTPAKKLSTKPEALKSAAVPAKTTLQGAWKINWLAEHKVSNLNIGTEADSPGVARFVTALTDLDGEQCKGDGFATSSLGGVFPLGATVSMIGVSDYLRIVGKCNKSQVIIEAFGIPGASVEWIGRAQMVDATGKRRVLSILASR